MRQLQKVTIRVERETVKVLDELTEKELTGSRGRSVDWLVRLYRRHQKHKGHP